MATISKLYSMREAAEHNTREDCWVVIDGKVYDVTTYLDEHPGGDDVLVSATGRDSSEDFEDAGHSKDARDLMKEFYIGELNENPVIPELEVFRKNLPSGVTTKLMNMTMQYWAAPAAMIAIAVVAGILYSRKN